MNWFLLGFSISCKMYEQNERLNEIAKMGRLEIFFKAVNSRKNNVHYIYACLKIFSERKTLNLC